MADLEKFTDVARELGVAADLNLPSQEVDDGAGENPINTDVIQLHRAWVNESVSPELLPYEERIVEETTALVENQEEILDELKKQDADQAWTGSLYTQDIDRMKFALARYLRARLSKIEAYAWKLQSGDVELLAKLSDAERAYAKNYVQLMSRHYSETVLSQMPEDYREFPDSATAGADYNPNTNTFVFARILEESGAEVQLDDNGAHELLEQNSIHVLRYPSIKDLVGTQLELI